MVELDYKIILEEGFVHIVPEENLVAARHSTASAGEVGRDEGLHIHCWHSLSLLHLM